MPADDAIEDAIQSSHPLSPPLFLPSIFPSIRSFPMSQFFPSGGQSIGASASASVLPMNIQAWFPLGWTGGISLKSKGFSRAFFSTMVLTHQFLGLPGSSVHGIFQARILEWVATSYYRGSSQPRDWTCISWVSCIVRWILFPWATWEVPPNT